MQVKPVYLLLATMTVAGVAGAFGSSPSDAPRSVEPARPLPASAVQSLGDPHAGMDMDPADDETTDDVDMEGEMPDDDIHRGMR